LKYHSYGVKNIINTNQYIPDIIPQGVKFRNNEILNLDHKERLLLGDQSLRHSYENLILATGLEPDFARTPGLLFSIKDPLNPIFSIYEYEDCVPKMAKYSHLFLKQILVDYEFKVTKENDNFIKLGGGNIIFTNCSEDIYEILYNMQMIILLFDLMKFTRDSEYLSSLKFFLFIPVTQDYFINFLNDENLSSFFLNLLNNRNIEIKWSHKFIRVESQQNLVFESQSKNVLYHYNFCLVMPHLIQPSFIRHNADLFEESIQINKSKLSLINTENIFILGDALSNDKNPDDSFYDRFDINIYDQAKTLANNLKVQNFRLEKNKIKNYQPKHKFYFDFLQKEFAIYDRSNKPSIKKLQKTFWNNYLFKQFYYNQNSFVTEKFFLKKIFGIN